MVGRLGQGGMGQVFLGVSPGGRPVATLAFDSTNNGYWVKRDTVSTLYRIDQYTGNQLAPADSTLAVNCCDCNAI